MKNLICFLSLSTLLLKVDVVATWFKVLLFILFSLQYYFEFCYCRWVPWDKYIYAYLHDVYTYMYIYKKQQTTIYIYIHIYILMYYVPKCPLKCIWLLLELCCKIYDVCQTILGCYALKSWHPALSPPICSKIFEKFIVDPIFNFMEQNSLWWTLQIYTTRVIEIFSTWSTFSLFTSII